MRGPFALLLVYGCAYRKHALGRFSLAPRSGRTHI